MSNEEISEQARMTAQRVLAGTDVSDGEMRFVTAGLLLSVDKLTHAIMRVESSMWSEERLRLLVKGEIELHCHEAMMRCQQDNAKKADGQSATWVGRCLRALFGG